jgi:hypothetical protein
MLDSELLSDFMGRFFGYGDLSASIWFVGMEEGGGNTEREMAQRLARWNDLGRRTVVDNAAFHAAVQNSAGDCMSYFFESRPKIQRTWVGLIRMLLSARGDNDDCAEAVRRIQSKEWGRTDSGNCLLELLPLPSPGVGAWHYDEWSTLSELASRESYRDQWSGPRAQALRQLVREHGPSAVVFYSVSPDYLGQWSRVAGMDLASVEPEQMCRGNQGQSFTARFAERNGTCFVTTYHPVYTGLTKEYFAAVGRTIRERTA